MMSMIVGTLVANGSIENFANLARYAKQLASHQAFQKADEVEAKYA